MSETLCTLRTKGGGGGSATWVETILWANPSPNTRMPASDSTISASVTLSDALSNYDYVKFVFKRNNSTYADSYTDVIYSVEEFKKYLASTAYAFRGSVSAFTNSTNVQITKKFSYVDDTTVMFVHTMSGTNSAGSYSQIIYDETLIPNQIIGIKKGRVPSYKTVKDFIHAKVFDSGLPQISTYTVYNNRVTVTEGKIVADAVSHKVYAYFDFTTNSAFGSASDWARIFDLSSDIANYLPVFVTSSRSNNIAFVTDDTSDVPTKQFAWGYAAQGTTYKALLSYGSTVQANEHYILYSEYTYK